MPNQKPNLILILSALLLAIIVGVVAVWWFLPSAEPIVPDESIFNTDQPSPAAPASSSGFNVQLFQRTQYQNLNHSLVTSGNLPVQPPAATGKANPFL